MKLLYQIAVAKASGGDFLDVPDSLWRDPQWIAERKFDGTRVKLHLETWGMGIDTRRICDDVRKGDQFGRYMDRTDNFPHVNKLCRPPSLTGATILDAEVLAQDGKCRTTTSIVGSLPDEAIAKQEKIGFATFHVFDLVMLNGVLTSESDMSLMDRRRVIAQILNDLDSPHLVLTEQVTNDAKLAFYRSEIDAGREGIMLKHVGGRYGDEKAWVKCKCSLEVDMVICGFVPAKPKSELNKKKFTLNMPDGTTRIAVGSVQVGFWDKTIVGDVRYVTDASGLPDDLKIDMAMNPQDYLGKACEVEAQEFTDAGSLRHPRFKRMRDDKNPSDCDGREIRKR